MANKVAIIGGCRTPFVKAGSVFAELSALDLAIPVLEKCLEQSRGEVEELIFSTVLLNPRFPNFARELALRSKLPKNLESHFVSNNCISGLLAASILSTHIQLGKKQIGFAGGAESMSRPTLTLSSKAEEFFIKLAKARSIKERFALITSWRPSFLFPVPPSPKEPSTGLTMGQHCEITTKEMSITREAQDQLALASHKNASSAEQELSRDIIGIAGTQKDGLVRANTTLEKLAALKPAFDKSQQGTITAGNASALTDGASAVILANPEYAQKKQLPILAYLTDFEFTAIDPSNGLLMAPVIAVNKLLHRNNLGFADLDYFEIHEAFAAQVLATLKAWEQGWPRFPELKLLGKVPFEKLNVRGGSLAIGHPFAATGARLLLNAARLITDHHKKRALVSACAAGGMGCAMLVERL